MPTSAHAPAEQLTPSTPERAHPKSRECAARAPRRHAPKRLSHSPLDQQPPRWCPQRRCATRRTGPGQAGWAAAPLWWGYQRPQGGRQSFNGPSRICGGRRKGGTVACPEATKPGNTQEQRHGCCPLGLWNSSPVQTHVQTTCRNGYCNPVVTSAGFCCEEQTFYQKVAFFHLETAKVAPKSVLLEQEREARLWAQARLPTVWQPLLCTAYSRCCPWMHLSLTWSAVWFCSAKVTVHTHGQLRGFEHNHQRHPYGLNG